MSAPSTETIAAPRPLAPKAFKAPSPMPFHNFKTLPALHVFGFEFKNITLAQAADVVTENAINDQRTRVYFVNAHCVNVAARNHDYCSVLHSADLLFADGAGLALAAKMWGKQFDDNINGTDLFPLICKRAVTKGIPIALLGAKPVIVKKCAENLLRTHPGLRIVWLGNGYYKEQDQGKIIDEINQSGAKMLFVAKGVPLQETWIHRNAQAIHAPVVMGVGALFDFCSGAVPRAPLVMRKLRLEWLFRFVMEPRRLFRRYVVGNPMFVLRALRLRLFGGSVTRNICANRSADS